MSFNKSRMTKIRLYQQLTRTGASDRSSGCFTIEAVVSTKTFFISCKRNHSRCSHGRKSHSTQTCNKAFFNLFIMVYSNYFKFKYGLIKFSDQDNFVSKTKTTITYPFSASLLPSTLESLLSVYPLSATPLPIPLPQTS